MTFDDRLTIETPEGVTLELTLAGLGSRFGAAAIDIAIQGIAVLVLVFALTVAGSFAPADLGTFLLGLGAFAVAAVVVGYYLVFETLNGGRTPGKAAFGLRVAALDGTPLTFSAVAVRTLMRLVDFLPAAYAVGAIAIVTNPRNQRLGDLAAGTVVIRDRTPRATPVGEVSGSGVAALGWDVSAVTEDEVALVRRFAARRQGLAPDARHRLASDLFARLRPKVGGVTDLGEEEFLLQILVEKAARAR